MALASTDRAFEELYTRHREALARYCRALVRNEHDARDVLQNVAVRVLLALRRGDRPARERAWLYRIARNEAVTLFRGRRQAEQLDEGIADPAADPTDTVLTRERLAELASDVRALSPQARTILMLSSSVELDRNQIAAELGLTPGAISQSLTETQTGYAPIAPRTSSRARRSARSSATPTAGDGAPGRCARICAAARGAASGPGVAASGRGSARSSRPRSRRSPAGSSRSSGATREPPRWRCGLPGSVRRVRSD